ncbi:transposon Ty3-I Gag-Pol polyprotein [Trichonephila clavipes]|nr:transposon Ty3-I Gag-Pol polyprotein [Trichonephila clavipes]
MVNNPHPLFKSYSTNHRRWSNFPNRFNFFLPHAKGKRTLLGVDFLRTSGIVMDMRNNFWYFGDKPSFRIPFSKDVPLPVDGSPVEINSSSCPTNSIPSEIPLHSNTVDETETNDLH